MAGVDRGGCTAPDKNITGSSLMLVGHGAGGGGGGGAHNMLMAGCQWAYLYFLACTLQQSAGRTHRRLRESYVTEYFVP